MKIYDYIKILLLTFAVFFGTYGIGCCSWKSNKSTINSKSHKIYKQINSNLTPLSDSNFLYMKTFIMGNENDVCLNHDENKENCNKKLYQVTSATGYVIKKDTKTNDLYLLTANHWCSEFDIGENKESEVITLPVIKHYAEYLGETYEIDIIKNDIPSDLCLAKFNSKYAKYAKNISIAKEKPELGEKLYTQSAPVGYHHETVRLTFEGYFSGCDYDGACMYTIPATYGSSGSPIINRHGELVGMIYAVLIDFNHVTVGPELNKIQLFLSDIY